MNRVLCFLAAAMLLLSCVLINTNRAVAAEAEVKLLPVNEAAVKSRIKDLGEKGPKGSKLVAYLDCGTQSKSTISKELTVDWVPSSVYQFPFEADPSLKNAKAFLPAYPTVFFDNAGVKFRLKGIDRKKKYLVGLTWWDYDASGRAQAIIVGSLDMRLVRIAVSAIGLPNYLVDKQPAGEKRFTLPVTFARKGEMQITIQNASGANAVISELWIWELAK